MKNKNTITGQLQSLSLFLTELNCNGRITWKFDEQQADPIHKMWPEMMAGWQMAITDVLAPDIAGHWAISQAPNPRPFWNRDGPLRHGIDCKKVVHFGTGHLHAAEDDTPYDVDGCSYCGRCHCAL